MTLKTAYTIELTESDVRDISIVGGGYGWSTALGPFEAGVVELTEPEAWEIAEAMEQDTAGGHSYFPMLDQRSDLAEKLYAFLDSIV